MTATAAMTGTSVALMPRDAATTRVSRPRCFSGSNAHPQRRIMSNQSSLKSCMARMRALASSSVGISMTYVKQCFFFVKRWGVGVLPKWNAQLSAATCEADCDSMRTRRRAVSGLSCAHEKKYFSLKKMWKVCTSSALYKKKIKKNNNNLSSLRDSPLCIRGRDDNRPKASLAAHRAPYATRRPRVPRLAGGDWCVAENTALHAEMCSRNMQKKGFL